jgi:hypothetical protein
MQGEVTTVDQGTDKTGISFGREVSGQFFVWIGIAGSALTLVSHGSNFLDLADWAHSLVSRFSALMERIWTGASWLAGIFIPTGLEPVLSLCLFF